MKWLSKLTQIKQDYGVLPVRRVATYVKAKVSGFLNGESVIEFLESNRAEDFISFLRKIRDANPEKRIVDNFRTHHARKVREEAEKLNISLVYLPPYSPDLNPIENVWKSIKRFVSEKSPLNVEKLKKTIAKAFKKQINILCKKLDREVLG